MRTLLLLSFVAMMAWFCLAAEKIAPRSASGTNNLTILNDGGSDVYPASSKVVFRKNVQVFEPDMYLECDLMTVQWSTNSPALPAAGGMTNLSAQIDTIIAETNFMMMARGTTILGDRAVYTRSNETFIVTGDLVVIQTEKILFFATNFVFNRLTSEGHANGWTATDIELGDAFKGTNALPNLGTGRKTVPATNATPARPGTK